MLVVLSLCAIAFGSDLAEYLATLDVAARQAKLAELQGGTTNVDEMSVYGAALAVTKQLEAHGRTDPSVVELFLRAALSSDPAVRQSAVDAAAANGDPPLDPVVAAPVVAPPPPPAPRAPSAAQLKDYAARRFSIGGLTLVSVGAYTLGGVGGAPATTIPVTSVRNTWTVYEGSVALTPITFSERVHDGETRERIRRTRAWAPAAGIGLGAVAAGLMTASLVVPWEPEDDAARWSLAIGGLGVGLGAIYPLTRWRQTNMMHGMYEQDEARGWCDRYNDGLRDRLGLTAEDTLAIDVQP